MYFQGEPSSCTSAGKAGTARMLYKKHELPKTVLWKGLANPDANPVATSTSSSAETHQGNCFHLWEMHKPLAVTFCGWPTAAKKVLFVKRTWNGPSLLKGDTFRHLKKEGESLDLLSPFLLLETLLVVSFAAVLELKLYLGRSPSTQGPPPGLAPQCTFRQPRGLLGPSASTVGHIFPDSHYNQPRWCRNIFPMLLDPGTQTPPQRRQPRGKPFSLSQTKLQPHRCSPPVSSQHVSNENLRAHLLPRNAHQSPGSYSPKVPIL